MKENNKERYVIGWRGQGQCIYGKEQKDGSCNYADSMTLKQAKRLRNKFPKANGRQKLLIYKLIPLKV